LTVISTLVLSFLFRGLTIRTFVPAARATHHSAWSSRAPDALVNYAARSTSTRDELAATCDELRLEGWRRLRHLLSIEARVALTCARLAA
jgi:hypothetical protein